MAYELGIAAGHYDLLAKIKTFVETVIPIGERYVVQRNLTSTLGTVSTITFAGTTATVTFSAPVTLWTGAYITIAGASDPLYNGSFAVDVIPGNTQCTYTMSDTPALDASGTLTAVRDDYECIWNAPGLSATDEIFFGIKTYQSITSDYYNFKIGGFTGYVPLNSFETQAGSSAIMGVPFWSNNMEYLIVANGRRLFLAVTVENVTESFYLGFCHNYATPFQWPYPLVVGGSFPTAALTRFSDTAHISWVKGHRANFELRTAAGLWAQPDNAPYTLQNEFPFPDDVYVPNQLRNTITSSATADGYYGLHPITMSDADNTYGELDGVYYISGFNNGSDNTLLVDGITYRVYRDIWRTGFNDYFAVKLA